MKTLFALSVLAIALGFGHHAMYEPRVAFNTRYDEIGLIISCRPSMLRAMRHYRPLPTARLSTPRWPLSFPGTSEII